MRLQPLVVLGLFLTTIPALAADKVIDVTKSGIIADGVTPNTAPLQKIIDEDPTIDVVDEFLGGFESLMTQPVRFH